MINPRRRTARMRKSSCLWSTSVLETVSSQSFSSWRKWMWMGRMPILCSCSWEKSSRSPATSRPPWLVTPSWSSGARSAGTTWPGTSRSSSSGQMECRSSVTAGCSSPATSRGTSRSSSARQSNQPTSKMHQLLSTMPTCVIFTSAGEAG